MNKLCLATALIVGLATGQARATDIGQIAEHGSDLRNMCLKNEFDVDTHTICYAMIDKLINDLIDKNGLSNKWWNIPKGIQLEELEQNALRYMQVKYTELDQDDAHKLVSMVLFCSYPSDELKAKLEADISARKECSTVFSHPSDTPWPK